MKSSNLIKITDFFDPYNIDHIHAYKIMSNTGVWPKDFLPENIESKINGWDGLVLMKKCVNAWIEQALAGHILGMMGKGNNQ